MTTEPPRGTKRKPIEIKNEPDEALDAIEEQNVGEQAPGSNKEPRLSLPKRQTIDFTGQKGDIVLVTGAEKSRLRVYSLFLSHVSPILESSLKQTGVGVTAVRHSNDTIPEVIFSEDDSVAFIMLCGVLHSHKTNQRARNKDIQSLAILADKYKCTHALSYVTHYWLSVGLRQASRKLAQDCWYSMTAAYWLQLPDLFCYWSGQLVSSHRDRSFLVFGNQITDHELGLKFCLALEEKRNKNRSHGDKYKHVGLCYNCFAKAGNRFQDPECRCTASVDVSASLPAGGDGGGRRDASVSVTPAPTGSLQSREAGRSLLR